MNARRWLLPSLTQIIWIAFFLAIMLTDWRQILISTDGDPCWHRQQGNWMIDHRAILRNDPFSHTRAGETIVSKEWLSEVIYAGAGKLLGWNGVVLVAASVIATMLALLHGQLLTEGSDGILSTVLVILAAAASTPHWLARPHVYTLCLVVVFAWQLRWYDRDRVTTRQLFLRLVPLAALWANLHGGFLAGLTLIGIYAVGDTVRSMVGDAEARTAARRRAVTLGLLAVACAFATLLNPNGWKLHQYLLSFLRTPYQAYFTSEWSSADFHFGGMRSFGVQLLLLGIALVALRPAFSTTDVLLVGFWLYSGLYAMRNVPIFALVVTPVLAEHLTIALRKAPDSGLWQRFRKFSEGVTALNRATGSTILMAATVVVTVVVATPGVFGTRALMETEVSTNRFPATTLSYLQAHPDAVHGEMFNDYSWGGYLILYLPAHRVFIDGRNDFYGEALLHEFIDVGSPKPAWQNVLEKYDVGWTILPAPHPLNRLLELSPQWTLVFSNQQALVFSRVS